MTVHVSESCAGHRFFVSGDWVYDRRSGLRAGFLDARAAQDALVLLREFPDAARNYQWQAVVPSD